MNTNNFCIIMAGGTGSRFWPLTQDNPKQFLDLLGSGESMLQSTFRRYSRICPRENIIIVTGASMVDRVRAQIPGLLDYQVLCEPLRRNTAPCVAYAAAVINDINPNANIIVSPSDHAIFNEDSFIDNINEAISVADHYDWIVTMGAQPTNPNTKYGYIQFDEQPATIDVSELHKVVTFTEKPPRDMAIQFIASDEFLWNAGIFIWRLPVLRSAYARYLPALYDHFSQVTLETSRQQLEAIYSQCESISIDFGIMEKADNVFVMKAAFGWSDVETWESLYDTAPKDPDGNVVSSGRVIAYDTHNCVFHLPPDLSVVTQGLQDYVVSSNGQVLLICPRDCQDRIIQYGTDLEMARLADKKATE